MGEPLTYSRLREAVLALPGRWTPERGYPGDHHGIDYVDREAVLALLALVRAAPDPVAGLREAFADAFMRHPTGRMADREVMAVLDAALHREDGA